MGKSQFAKSQPLENSNSFSGDGKQLAEQNRFPVMENYQGPNMLRNERPECEHRQKGLGLRMKFVS